MILSTSVYCCRLTETDDDVDYFHGDFSQALGQNKPQSSSSNQILESNESCGIATATPSPLIARGQETRAGKAYYIKTYFVKQVVPRILRVRKNRTAMTWLSKKITLLVA